MNDRLRVFVSSRMAELAEERQIIKSALSDLQIDAWVFEEDAGARPVSIQETYLDEVEKANIYLGLFWLGYGAYTIEEYEHARKHRKPCFVYQKQVDVERRDRELQSFLDRISRVEKGVTIKWFEALDELAETVRQDLARWQADFIYKRQAARGRALLYRRAEDIPAKPAILFGRDEMLEAAGGFLEDARHVLLTGYGGTGKSALAATIAARRIQADGRPVIWLRAGYADSETIFEAIAQLFDAKQDIDQVEDQARIQKIKELLTASKAGLLVLDDVRKPQAIVALREAMPETLPLLITSRYDIRNADETIAVSELTPGYAVDLLVHHAVNARFGEEDYRNDPRSAQLCRELAFHPLGITIAGTWLAKRERRAEALLQRIESRKLAPSTIEMPESFVQEGRETVKIVLDEMFYELDEQARKVFNTFGALFTPKVSVDLLAELVEGVDLLDVEDALDELASWNFVRREEADLYSMHDMIHSYAETVLYGLEKPDRQAAISAVRRFVAEHAREHDMLGLDMPNILAAGKEARQSDAMQVMVQIVGALVMGEYFDHRGHTQELLDLLDASIQALRKEPRESDELFHHMLCKRGNAYVNQGNLEKGFDYYQEAYDVAPTLHRKTVLLCGLGGVCAMQGNNVEAEKYFQEAYELANTSENPKALIRVLEYQSDAAFKKGDHEAARDLAFQGLEISIQLEDRLREGAFRVTLGAAEFNIGIFKSLENHRAALQIAAQVGDLSLQADALFNIAIAHHALEDFEQAKDNLQQALSLYQRLGHSHDERDVSAFMQRFGYA